MKHYLYILFLLFLLLSPIHAQKVGLVLSGGGAKGLTHIGIIRALEENGIPIDYIAGTYNPQIEMFARFKTKSSFHKTKRII